MKHKLFLAALLAITHLNLFAAGYFKRIASLAFPSHTRVTFSDGTVMMNGSIVTQEQSTPKKDNPTSLNKRSRPKASKPGLTK